MTACQISLYVVATNYTLFGYFRLNLHLLIIEPILRGHVNPNIFRNSLCGAHSFAVVLINTCARKPDSMVLICTALYMKSKSYIVYGVFLQ